MAINSTSFTNTPQAGDDIYNLTEDQLFALGIIKPLNILSLDVMSNDLGGNAKKLFSVDDGNGNALNPTDLLQADGLVNGVSAWESTAQGNLVRINNGKIEVDVSHSLSAIGAGDVNAMGASDAINDTFVYAIRLANGTLSWATVRINVTGSNDAATITASNSEYTSVVEAGGTNNGTLGDPSAGGQLTVHDVDHGQAVFQAVAATSLVGTYGNFTFDSTSGVWHYSLDQSKADVLVAGQHVTDALTVTSLDGTASQTIKVTVTGTNDAATINASTSEDLSVKEDVAGNTTAGGTLTASDVDSGENHFQAPVAASLSGTYGTFAFNETSGVWGYTLDNSKAATQALGEGVTQTETLTVKSVDGTASYDIKVTVTGTNDAATMTAASPSLTGITEDQTSPAGTLVSTLLGVTVSDVDTGAVQGIAITGATSTNGTWQFSTDGGTNYTNFAAYSAGTALQLAATDLVRFNPNAQNGGTDTFTYKAWDQSTGTHGTTASASTSGGTTAFSTQSNTATIIVSSVNDAPVLSATVPTTQKVDVGVLVSSFLNSTDVDSGALKGIAITGATGQGSGSWEYSLNGTNWVALGTVTATSALLLRNTDHLRMVGGNNAGTLTYKAWDQTSGTVATNVNPGAGGGTSAFSTTSVTWSVTHPAGIAGEPINLALANPPDHVGAVMLTISGVPSGWTLSAGIDNGDGTWTVQTNDPSSVTITTPANFTGAVVLGVSANWTNADGSTGSAMVSNNVEAYAPGSPIFAVSADDNLTASSAADLLVFAQPIANDVVHNFDAAADKIDLIGFDGVNGFADLAIADDANGNAVIALANGSTITLLGVHAADLGAANFEFNVEPVTVNVGTMTIANGAILPLGGTVENSGTIMLGSTGSQTNLEVLVESLTLHGGGHVVLSDDSHNVIYGGSANATLINLDNTISGAGQIGAGQMTLVNAGTIIADGSHALVIDTGNNVVDNTGTLEATGGGGLVVDSAVNGSGSLWANGGAIVVQGEVSGHGSATISGSGALEFGAASDANVGFAGDASGTLTLDHAAGFTGTLAGLNTDDNLHFGDIAFSAATQVSYTANAADTAGSLVVSDGTHTAQMTLIGQYSAADFHLVAGQGGSTEVVNTATDNATVLGGPGANVLTGTAGNDIIVGGAGSDWLTGGAGSDTFMFLSNSAGAVHTITDFDVGAGGDVLNIGALLQGYSSGADLSQFISLLESGSGTIVSIDSDGAGAAHGFQDLLVLQGVTGLDFSTLVAHVDAHPLP